MYILWRYILKEHVGPFIFAFSVITLVFLLNLIFRELGRILSRGLGARLVFEFFFLNMAWIVALAVPMAVLVATLMAFGRLSGDNEIVAMKASGISILRILFPVLVVSLFLSAFLIWFNNNVLPDFNHRARLLASDIARKRPTISLEPGVIYRDLPGYSILVRKIREVTDTSYVQNVFIEDNSDPTVSKIIFADKGKIFLSRATSRMILILYNGEMHELNLEKMEEYRKLTFPKQRLSITIPNMSLKRSNSEYRGDREKSAQLMLKEVRNNEKTIRERQERIHKMIDNFFQKYLPVPSRPLKDIPSARVFIPGKGWRSATKTRLQRAIADHQRLKQQITAEINVIKHAERANYVLMVEVHKKYSIPIACIVFVLVGAPLGIMARKGNLAVAGGISFGFFLLYWASLIGGEELADNQIITPFMAMWLANFVVGAGGIYLVVHSIHEATFINWISISQLLKKPFNLFPKHENT